MDATQQLTPATPALSDLVTRAPNHRMNQFISSNPRVPTINARTTPAPTFTPFWDKLRTAGTPQASATSKLPALATYPRGKPRITKGNFQIMSVKAETDAVLPCAANGEPKPFLSWTKVSTGTSILRTPDSSVSKCTKTDLSSSETSNRWTGGEYLCTVQNQYGSDQLLTNVVVLSQHPKILQPRHRDVSINLGSDVDLHCQVGRPPQAESDVGFTKSRPNRFYAFRFSL
ncbi:hypothetical protein WMY93_022222 [Mugilogobius chulae]|uniref:Ig-like domain-containing protein n=1 Tax=Mugilogobius chulae TaxID=88201 RepID=A0AAW0N6A7_9GOBI